MKFAQLGATGLYVSRIALGTMSFGGAGSAQWEAIGALDETAADRLVGTALDHGVNLIDTADMYAGGESEQMLGRILTTRRDDVVLATKLAARMGPGPNQAGLTRHWITKALDDSLRRLRTDHIDLYQIHTFDPITPIEETLRALDDAVRQGKIRYLGASNLAAWQLMKALGTSDRLGLNRFQASQSYYSLAGRDIETELVPLLLEEKVGLLVWSPLAGGFLSGKFDRDGTTDTGARRAKFSNPPVDLEQGYDIVDVLRKVADQHDATVAQTALAWLLARPAVTSVIVGAKRPEQLTANLAAVDLTLTPEDLSALDEVSRTPLPYPHWMHADMSWRHPA
ncbi:aldo/keto reductase [Kribbella sp. ALI-6-A]|uniref:aldo/keto reductase n=1 Tax=Kribbella sp. ALI-6-A TaxID=1933817 RepID=UPI00097C8809|nr:aldo/keto reductase [Kribbella sp. ALI-6-A]ONI75764.1 aldo/keto reductase [Kribbella sp. ALI-6-A]